AGEDRQHSGLDTAGVTENADEFPAVDAEVDVLHRGERTCRRLERLREPGELERHDHDSLGASRQASLVAAARASPRGRRTRAVRQLTTSARTRAAASPC